MIIWHKILKLLKGKNMWKGKENLQNILVWLVPSLFVFLLSFSFIYLSYLDKDFYKLFILTFLAAGLGAGIPAWLVWYLTINREEKKKQEDEKNALLVEYTKALKNLTEANLLHKLSTNTIGSEFTYRSICFFNSSKHNLYSLTSANNLYVRTSKKDLGSPLFLRISTSENISTKISSYIPSVDKTIKDNDRVNHITLWKLVEGLSKMLINVNYHILLSIANYIDLKYHESYIEDLEKLETYKESQKISKEYEKKGNSNVPTEELPK